MLSVLSALASTAGATHVFWGGERTYGDDLVLTTPLDFDVDLSRIPCGMNAALYFVPMQASGQEGPCGSYCDANSVCGVACAEIDVMEANSKAFRSTVHKSTDPGGSALGYGAWGDDAWEFGTYGPSGSCVDTRSPFRISTSVSEESLRIRLSQGRCHLTLEHTGLDPEVTAALHGPITPVMSLWSSDEGMEWLDGKACGWTAPCDSPHQCDQTFFSVSSPLLDIVTLSAKTEKADFRNNSAVAPWFASAAILGTAFGCVAARALVRPPHSDTEDLETLMHSQRPRLESASLGPWRAPPAHPLWAR